MYILIATIFFNISYYIIFFIYVFVNNFILYKKSNTKFIYSIWKIYKIYEYIRNMSLNINTNRRKYIYYMFELLYVYMYF